MSDVERALAFVAKREAKLAMSLARWSHLLSFGLGWMNPGQARAFVDRGVRAGLLAPDGDNLRLVIDPANVAIPRGFKPDPQADSAAVGGPSAPSALGGPSAAPPSTGPGSPAGPAPTGGSSAATHAAAAPDPFLGWVARLAAHHGMTREQILGRVAMVQERMGGFLTAEAAVLVLAREAGMDVVAAAQAAERALHVAP